MIEQKFIQSSITLSMQKIYELQNQQSNCNGKNSVTECFNSGSVFSGMFIRSHVLSCENSIRFEPPELLKDVVSCRLCSSPKAASSWDATIAVPITNPVQRE